ncbi:MAG: Holliday junction resolvase RuvX [candidate division Zixibacteria bacterium]|nr:Holliday junction resolvase RuvX [candidate division Zixibacteria bacterium]
MARILSIDFGERRIGLAVSDPLGITAQGLPTIDTRKTKDILSYIRSIIEEKNVTMIVVGMPKNMNGSIGFKGKEVKRFIGKLTQKTGVKVIAWDERLTSVQSLKSMREMGTKQKKKEAVDRISATLILQSYLDSLSKEDKESLTDEI